MAFDPMRDVVVLFGGAIGLTGKSGETWEYRGGSWEQVLITGSTPVAQRFPVMTYHPGLRRLVLIDEAGGTWSYDGTWLAHTGTASRPGENAALVYDPLRKRLVMFGGGTSTSLSDETWEIEVTDTEASWTLVDTAGVRPVARLGHAMCSLAGARSIVVFGGQGAATGLGDTWFLQRRSSTPDEICDNGSDDDGDHRIDLDDPDC
jgi:hypothetical protein